MHRGDKWAVFSPQTSALHLSSALSDSGAVALAAGVGHTGRVRVRPDAFEPPAGQDGRERVTAGDLPLKHFNVTGNLSLGLQALDI